MNKTSKYVYTLKDVITYGSDDPYNPFTFIPSDVFFDLGAFFDSATLKIASIFPEVFLLNTDGDALDKIEENCCKLLDYIYAENHEQVCIIMYQDHEPTNTEIMEQIMLFTYSLFNKLNASASRYKNLLNLYKSQENDLLAQIHSRTTGVSRFNDTPQNYSVGGVEYEDNTHNTNVTKSEGDVYSDGVTIMERLNEIQEKYRNLLIDWGKEFKEFFISSYNYEEEQ